MSQKTYCHRIWKNAVGICIYARPKKDGRYPVLIWNRGGSRDRGALDDLRAYLILASTAVWGYVVLATQYRGNMGGEGEEDWGGKDLDDSLLPFDRQIGMISFLMFQRCFHALKSDQDFVSSSTRRDGSKSGFFGSIPHSFSTSDTNLLKSSATESERGAG